MTFGLKSASLIYHVCSLNLVIKGYIAEISGNAVEVLQILIRGDNIYI